MRILRALALLAAALFVLASGLYVETAVRHLYVIAKGV